MVEIRGDGTIMRTLFKICSPVLVFSLCLTFLLGTLFPYSKTEAGFFSSLLLGDDAYAQTNTTNPTQSSGNTPQNNSQTMALLQANISSLPIFQDPGGPRQGGTPGAVKKNNQIDENATVNIVSDNALFPNAGPIGASGAIDNGDSSVDQTSVYVIRKGDSLSKIAQMFGVSVNTILAANDMKKGDKLVEGGVLFILPISGLEHTVTKGQTLQSIAKLYKADVNDIALYNGITEDTKLTVGDTLMIPGGEMADEGGDKPAPNLAGAVAKDKNYYILHPLQDLFGYFLNPVPTGHKTQGLHGPGHRGIDIGAPKGTPIYASAIGTVLIAKTGWSGGYGTMAILEHPNGTKTLYAHMSKVAVHTGDQVAQAEVIGYVGSTGRSTGPHLHFEVFNAKNPGTNWSWKN